MIRQRSADGIDVLGAFGQRKHFAALPEGVGDRAGDGRRSGCVLCQMPELILDARLRQQSDRRLDELLRHRQIARRIQRFLSQPMHVAEVFSGIPGAYVPVDHTVESFRAIIDGEVDDLPEAAFFMVGTLDDARLKAKRLADAAAGQGA